jgi:hypothetical protein
MNVLRKNDFPWLPDKTTELIRDLGTGLRRIIRAGFCTYYP